MASPVLIKNRYEIKDVLGRGGMGVVYKAFDTLMRRDVALKTLRDVASNVFVDLFYRECSVLTAMVHPNVVEIFDMGEFEEDGVSKPYFVMPLLPGRTLYDLIYPAGTPLPPVRCADIISQACRGLHAAHECSLLHRDIKPRNIFVMKDDAVKLIDFGVVRLLGHQTVGTAGTLGTLHYMAPEQISMKPLTARSDIFSLATVCYEALTAVHPFVRENEGETAAAVMEHTPALASTLNPAVSRSLAQVIAQAMAKDPRNRFESAVAFGDALQRGLRNERSESVPVSSPQTRLARAQRSFARGDYEFAREILQQLEAEGADLPEISELRSELDATVQKRHSEVTLATAQRYFDEEEHVLALRRVNEVLDMSPANAAGVKLKNEIEEKIDGLRIADLLGRASGFLDSGLFSEADSLVKESLRIRPGHPNALKMHEEVGRAAREWPRERQQQEELFQASQNAYFGGRFDVAVSSLEQLAELTRSSRAAGARVTEYKEFYKRVRGDYDALQATLADARKLLANDDLESAFLLSERLREQCPQDPDVRAISKDISDRRNERVMDYRRSIASRIASDPDLSAQLHILNQAARARPNDDYFQVERQKVQGKLQQVGELVDRAHTYEAAGHFDHAMEEWLCVRDVYPAFPHLKDQLARVKELWEESREKARTELAAAVTAALAEGDQELAAQLLRAARGDFQDDEEYQRLQDLQANTGEAHKETKALLSRLQKAEAERRFGDIPTICQVTVAVGKNVVPLRTLTFDALVALASRITSKNWRVAEQVLREAERVGPVPAMLYQAIRGEEREEEVGGILGEDGRNRGDLDAYRGRVAELLAKYPSDSRLDERLQLIDAALADKRKQDERKTCAAELKLFHQELGDIKDHRRLWDAHIHAKSMAAPFPDDPEIAGWVDAIGKQVSLFEEAASALNRDRIQDCYAICHSMLAQRPGHYLFQLLKEQAGTRHRELGEEYFARVERWLASEPDVFEREKILLKARAEFPFDSRYAKELEDLQTGKFTADSLATKAHELVQRGQVAEALAQWRQLRDIHPSFPGLEDHIADCQSVLDRQQRKNRAQRLLAQGQALLAEGKYDEGYQVVLEARETSQEAFENQRTIAPGLVVAARAVLPANARLADALLALAQSFDSALRLPKDLRGKVGDARRAEEQADCLKTIQQRHADRDLKGALAAAESFLASFPGVKPIESLRAKILLEIENEERQYSASQALEEFREMELSAVNLSARGVSSLKKRVLEMAAANPGDEEVKQRASTLSTLFSALADVRTHLEQRSFALAGQACARAEVEFPGHPLFKSALAEAARQKQEDEDQHVLGLQRRMAEVGDFSTKAQILKEGLAQFPGNAFLTRELDAVTAGQQELNSQIETARSLEAKQMYVEAVKQWEALATAYPWHPGANSEVERIQVARRKEKQDALDRWFRQVEEAIDTGDYDSASVMIRQAQQQQQTDATLKSLEEKLNAGLKKKEESDSQFAEGRQRLMDGDLVDGGRALYRAFALQPKDREKTNSIVLLMLAQIRADVTTDFAGCESLLSHLDRIRPGQMLPPDLRETISRKQQDADFGRARSNKALEQVARLAEEAERAKSKRSLSSVSAKVYDSGLLKSRDIEVRRAASEVLRKINLRLSGIESPRNVQTLDLVPVVQGRRGVSTGMAISAALLLVAAALVVFFLTQDKSRNARVQVQIKVTPERAFVELDGKTCIAPDCMFSVRPGDYTAHIHKAGYQAKSVGVQVKNSAAKHLEFNATLEPLAEGSAASETNLAKVMIRGALPRTRIRLDGEEVGAASADGVFVVQVPPGPHTLDLSLDGFNKRTIKRDFAQGETVSLIDSAVQLEPALRPVRR